MYALISVYDDTNKCVYARHVLSPSMVNHNGEYTTYRFEFSITVAENQAPTMKGKFKHDDIPEPETNEWMDQEVENGRRAADDFVNKLDNSSQPVKNRCMICGRVIYDDKVICDKCFEIAKREGLMI